MKKEAAVRKVLARAESQVGYREGANNWNQYAEGRDGVYGWHVQNQPWCDIFVDVLFIDCFGPEPAARMTYQPIGGFSAGCAVSADYYRQHGAFVRTPQPGDQIFFYVNGGINHTGIVVRVDGGTVETIEGNSSDMVARRYYSVGDGKIAGYGRPDWSVVSDSDTVADKPTDGTIEAPGDDPGETEPNPADSGFKEVELCTVEIPTARFGDCGAAVAALQAGLRHVGYDPTWIDGEFGERTEACVLAFQQDMGIDTDPPGTAGQDTWEQLLRL